MSKVPLIAIIDDDESFRRATVRFIRSLGYEATAFASAQAFLTSNDVRGVDCLITDLQMPGMTGIEVQNQLITQGRRLPIIFVTAYPETKAAAQVLAAGAVGFLDKPFNHQKLIKCLSEALAARGA